MAIAEGLRVRWGAVALIALVASLAAAGCGGSEATPETIYITPPPGPATPLPSGVTPGPGLPSPAIDSLVITSEAPDSRWTVTFKKPTISGISAGAASKMNDAITAKVNGYISSFSGGNLPVPASGAGPSTLEGDFTIAFDSPDAAQPAVHGTHVCLRRGSSGRGARQHQLRRVQWGADCPE